MLKNFLNCNCCSLSCLCNLLVFNVVSVSCAQCGASAGLHASGDKWQLHLWPLPPWRHAPPSPDLQTRYVLIPHSKCHSCFGALHLNYWKPCKKFVSMCMLTWNIRELLIQNWNEQVQLSSVVKCYQPIFVFGIYFINFRDERGCHFRLAIMSHWAFSSILSGPVLWPFSFGFPVLQLRGVPFKSGIFRLRTRNGCWVEVETEWSSFINPWSNQLDFIIGQHTVVKWVASSSYLLSGGQWFLTSEVDFVLQSS